MFKNPQLIHIAVEVIVLLALIFWFHTREKRMALYTKTLLQRIDDLELRMLHQESINPQNSPKRAHVVVLSPEVSHKHTEEEPHLESDDEQEVVEPVIEELEPVAPNDL